MPTIHTSSRGILPLVLLGCLSVSALADGPSWPQFHGPNQDNKSPDTGLLDRWPQGGPELVWKADGLGYGYSSVSIADGCIFTTGNIGEKTVVTALDAADGHVLWQKPNGPAWTKQFAGTRSTPTIDGDRVYDETPLGELVCLEAATGKRVWGMNILDAFEGENIFWGLSESVLIDGDRLICCPGGKHSVVALNKLTGKVIWKAPSVGQPPSYCTPTLAEYQGLRIIITLALKSMIGVNADTGELLWKVEFSTLHDENVLQPVYHDGQIFVSGLKTGSVKWKINVDGKKASVEELWRSKEMDNHHDHVILLDGYLYGSSCILNSGKWICLDWETGEMQYAERGVGKGTLTYADGMLYTLAERLVVGLVKPTPNGHEVISQFSLVPQGKAPSWAHPVVCGKRLYLRHAGILYVYDVAK